MPTAVMDRPSLAVDPKFAPPQPIRRTFQSILGAGAARMTSGRRAKAATRRSRKLRRDFFEDKTWVSLASSRGLMLPIWGEPPAPGAMEHWLHRLGLAKDWYRAWSGFRDLADFATANPDWPLRAWAGLVLEELARQEALAGVERLAGRQGRMEI